MRHPAVLSFILGHGEVTSTVLFNAGLNGEVVDKVLGEGIKSGLIFKHDETLHGYDPTSPLAAMHIKTTYWISPTLRDALSFILEHEH